MLQEFKVRNYKNFRDELFFSFRTSKNYEFNRELVKNGIIKDCLVVGENASGKTNLGYAIFDIIWHLTDKVKKGRLCIQTFIVRIRPYSLNILFYLKRMN